MAKPESRATGRARSTRLRSTRRSATRVARSLSSFLYVESSGLLAALLEHDTSARTALRSHGQRVTSALTIAEASRALVRARVGGRLTQEEERAAIRALKTFERRCAVVSVTNAILTRAGRPFPVEPIRTLDAIQLATADALGDSPQLVTVLTRDARVRDNARALGYTIA